MLADLLFRVRAVLRRRNVEQDLDEELRAHLEHETAKCEQSGVPRAEAARQARRALGGGLDGVKEQCRDARGTRLLEDVRQDLRYACRLLYRRPAFTLTVVASLAIGIGANTAVFSVVDAVLLRQLPLPQPEELAVVWSGPLQGEPDRGMAPANALDLAEQARTLASTVPFSNTAFVVQEDMNGERIPGMRVGWRFFPTLGVAPALGRDLGPSDDVAGAEPVVVVSHGVWQRWMASDPLAVGQSIVLGGVAHVVVGVMPAGFRLPELFGAAYRPEIWTPNRFSPPEASSRGSGYVFALSRRQPATSWRAVQNELDSISKGFARVEPDRFTHRRLQALPLHEQVVGDVRTALLVLWGAVACVLMATCANVANLLLSRATHRAREMAIRTSLGAPRGRIVRQLLAESVVLSGVGAALGVAVAIAALRLLSASELASLLPRAHEIGVDVRTLAFAVTAGLVTAALCGVLPAMHFSRVPPQTALRASGYATTAGAMSGARLSLVVGQIAVALVLAVGAGLLVRSFAAVQRVDLGFAPDDLLTFDVSLRGGHAPDAAAAFFDRLEERLAHVPGVTHAGAISHLPMGGGDFGWTFMVRDRPPALGVPLPSADVRMASPGALGALQMPLRAGRWFRSTDTRSAQPVAVVSETFARRNWPGEDPLGKEIKLEGPIDRLPWMTVVGVVADVHYGAPDLEPPPAIYRPRAQHGSTSMAVVVRATRDAHDVLPRLREEVKALGFGVALVEFRAFSHYLSRAVAQRRLLMTLLSAFAGMTLLLALTGVYGVLAYGVAMRTREIGIRMALGAARTQILMTVMQQALVLALIGIACGLVASLAVRRAIPQQLFAVEASDPLTLGIVSGLVLGTALLASYLPARRAANVQPVVALRAE